MSLLWRIHLLLFHGVYSAVSDSVLGVVKVKLPSDFKSSAAFKVPNSQRLRCPPSLDPPPAAAAAAVDPVGQVLRSSSCRNMSGHKRLRYQHLQWYSPCWAAWVEATPRVPLKTQPDWIFCYIQSQAKWCTEQLLFYLATIEPLLALGPPLCAHLTLIGSVSAPAMWTGQGGGFQEGWLGKSLKNSKKINFWLF